MTDTIGKHTVSMYFVDSAVRHLSLAARDRVLVQAGIPVQLLDVASARVPATAFSSLWLSVARELDDEFFGLDRRAMKVGSFALVAQAAITCKNLGQAAKRVLRAFRVFLDDISAELVLEGQDAGIHISNHIEDDADRRFADETLLILVHGLLCWLCGQRIPLNRVCFSHARSSIAREYALMYCDQLSFGAERTCMYFDAELLQSPVVQNSESLGLFLRTAPQSVFLKYRNEQSWTAQVRQRLRMSVDGPAGWPIFDELAAQLGTTVTTLRRRLHGEGISYQLIKDSLRNDLAVDYLCNTALSIEDIGPALGFHDASAFHRAFKRWNSIQPGEYRRQMENCSP
jgi:AraC-like DNA-binding protein